MVAETLNKTSTAVDQTYPVRSMTNTVTLTASTEDGDIYKMLNVKKGMRVVDVIFTSADVDQAALEVGIPASTNHSADPNLFITVADADGSAFRLDNATGANFTFLDDTTIDVEIGTVTTPGTVAMELTLLYVQAY